MDLSDLRKEIDRIDKEILDLLNRRAETALEIGKHKQKTNKSFFAPEREREVFERLTTANKGPLPNASLLAIYREIISASRALERPLTVVYWGPPATNTHMASIQKFGSSSTFVPADTIPDVFSEVERERADFGIVPIENSTEGVINHTLDTFLQSDLKICSEIYLPITHNLLSMEDGHFGHRARLLDPDGGRSVPALAADEHAERGDRGCLDDGKGGCRCARRIRSRRRSERASPRRSMPWGSSQSTSRTTRRTAPASW